MTAKLYAGPYDTIAVGAQTKAPWYMLPFDEAGRCTGPLTRANLIETAKKGDFTDIYIFSHGWNNDWRAAVGDDGNGVVNGGGYRGLINGYIRARAQNHLAYDRPYRPLLVGIFWPSTWLVLPWEQGPHIAAIPDDPAVGDQATADERETLASIAKQLNPKDIEEFYRLTQAERLNEAEARELARILLPLYRNKKVATTTDVESPATVQTKQLVAAWRTLARRGETRDTGQAGGRLRRGNGDASIAGGDDSFDPRLIIRGASVWQMKDRAGVVGAYGVGPLLGDLLANAPDARTHLIGHSFGCRVLLSAICAPTKLPRPVDSLLLLEPAISHLCFATDVAGSGKPGGYRSALQRIKLPIMLTFTRQDGPLHDWFHFALVRPSDLGEAAIAGDEPPSPYAALGGYGPRGTAPGECITIPIKPLGESYDLGNVTARIIALNSTDVILGHGDINKDQTWWALYSQVAQK